MENPRTIDFFGIELVENEAKLLKEFYKNNDFLTKRRNKNLEKTIKSLFKRESIIAKDGQIVGIGMLGETLEKFPPEISYFEKLQGANLAANKISEIPKEFYKLNHLTSLSMRENPLSSIRGISKLENLEILNMYSCYFHCFSKEITRLDKLKKVNFGLNPGEFLIPPEISNMKSLEGIYLFETRLKSISKNILKLENLKEIDIRHKNMDYRIIPVVDKLLEQGVKVEYIFD
ncbi:leucine-rich repeat domain-containing protein [archaeon]|nr:leucine-rich repeat domain-containing protein [archaeon]